MSNDSPLLKSANQALMPLESELKDLKPKSSQKQPLRSSQELVPVSEHNNFTTKDDFKELDQKVKSMFEFSENPAPGNTLGKARICKVCGCHIPKATLARDNPRILSSHQETTKKASELVFHGDLQDLQKAEINTCT